MCMCAFDQDGFTHTVHLTCHPHVQTSNSCSGPPSAAPDLHQLQNHDIAYNWEVVKLRITHDLNVLNTNINAQIIPKENGPKPNDSWPERTKLINNDMWLVQSANTKQTFTLIWSAFLKSSTNVAKWRSPLHFQSSSAESPAEPEPQLYVHIWQNNYQTYKEIMSVWCLSSAVAQSSSPPSSTPSVWPTLE